MSRVWTGGQSRAGTILDRKKSRLCRRDLCYGRARRRIGPLKEPGGIKRQVPVSKDRVDFCNSVYSRLHTNVRTNRNPLWNTSTWHFTVWVLAVWRIANVFQFSTGGIRLTLSSLHWKLGGRGFRRCTPLSRTAQQHATIQVKKMHHLRLIIKLLLQPSESDGLGVDHGRDRLGEANLQTLEQPSCPVWRANGVEARHLHTTASERNWRLV